jgi:short-subunit dehydrogenase
MNPLIVVTGGTKGIGKAIIHQFAQQGYDLATCARKNVDLQKLKTEIETKYNTKLHCMAADLSQKQEIYKFADFVHSLKQNVEALINNTGMFMPGSILEEPEGNLEYMMDTNLYSAYYLTRELVKPMIERKDGYIFNICSIASFAAYPNGGSYSISKFAMYGMTKVLREELKPYNIRVTAVLPGATLTASWEGVNLPHDRFMKAEDVAELIYSAFVLSKRSVVEEIIIRPQLGDL